MQGEKDYWQANLKLVAKLLTIWFLVSFGFGIILVDQLNQIPFFGFKLGFWWGSAGLHIRFHWADLLLRSKNETD